MNKDDAESVAELFVDRTKDMGLLDPDELSDEERRAAREKMKDFAKQFEDEENEGYTRGDTRPWEQE